MSNGSSSVRDIPAAAAPRAASHGKCRQVIHRFAAQAACGPGRSPWHHHSGWMRTPKPCLLPKRPTTRQGLLASGMTAQMIRTALNSGRLKRLRRGVFVDADVWPDDARDQHLLLAAAELEVHHTAVLSHESAAASWGLPHPGFVEWHAGPVSLTVPPGDSVRSRASRCVHRIAPLPGALVTRDGDGRPITTLARTAVDLALLRSLPDALVILDGAARLLCAAMVAAPRRRDYANPRLAAAVRQLFEHANLSRRAAGLSAAIELCDPRRESAPESMSAGHFHLAALPAPQCQAKLQTPIGDAFPDFYWPEHNLIGECDGAVKYADAQAYVREKEREQALRDLGYRMVRWQAKEIMVSPNVVVERVARQFD